MMTFHALILGLMLLVAGAQPLQGQTDAEGWKWFSPGGVSARPFIRELSATTNGTTTISWSGATSPTSSPPAGFEQSNGRLSAVVSPTNMCVDNSTSNCHAVPNRVDMYFGYTSGGALSDFSSQSSNVHNITSETVVDMTLDLNYFANLATSSWMNGDLLFWQLQNGTLRVKFRPVPTPSVQMPNGSQCCTCDMPSNCDVLTSSGYELSSNFFISMGGPSAFTGAVFATKNAIMGAIAQDPASSSLQYKLAGAHLAPDGSMMQGEIKGFVPMAVITALYPTLKDASSAVEFLNVTRSGDNGTTGAISLSPWTVADEGGDGIALTVTGITFSAPTYTLHCSSCGTDTNAANRGFGSAWLLVFTWSMLRCVP